MCWSEKGGREGVWTGEGHTTCVVVLSLPGTCVKQQLEVNDEERCS